MNILAVDCSADTLAVGLARISQGQSLPRMPKHPFREEQGHANAPGGGLVSVSIDSGFRHVERLMGAIDYCVREAGLQRSQLDLLACAAGPGSFTGLRIAMATVKGMALGLNKPFVAVPTLDALAADWEGAAPVVVPVLDAKRGHFYFAVYQYGALLAGPFDDSVHKLVGLVDSFPEVLFVGPDASMLESMLSERPGYRIALAARRSPIMSLVRLAAERFRSHGGDSDNVSPLYLRASDAEEEAKARQSV